MCWEHFDRWVLPEQHSMHAEYYQLNRGDGGLNQFGPAGGGGGHHGGPHIGNDR